METKIQRLRRTRRGGDMLVWVRRSTAPGDQRIEKEGDVVITFWRGRPEDRLASSNWGLGPSHAPAFEVGII